MATTQSDQRAESGDEGMPPRYRVYDIDAVVYDMSGNIVAEWNDVQELWLEPPAIAVRRTRSLPDGSSIVYEDRGKLGPDFQITGDDGFGGAWSGRPLPQDGMLFTQGSGPTVSFYMTNWVDKPGEERCLRVLDVHEPVAFLSESPLEPGRYYVRTHDHLRSASDDVPDSMKHPAS
jgi:hypothetical protein